MTDLALEDHTFADVPLARDLVPTDRRLLPAPLERLQEAADIIAQAGGLVPAELRKDPGACMAVAYMAALHGTDLVATASQTYIVSGKIAFMAQYLNALVQRHFADKPAYVYQGTGQTRAVKVTAKLKSGQVIDYTSPQLGQISPKNSPLWKTDPDQQLSYMAIRALARRHMPDVLLGIYAVEELQSISIRDVTAPPPDAFASDEDLDNLPEAEATVDGEQDAPFEPSGGFTEQTQEPTYNPAADDPLEWAELCKQDARDATDETKLRTLWTANKPNRDALKKMDPTAFNDLEAVFIDRQKELRAQAS